MQVVRFEETADGQVRRGVEAASKQAWRAAGKVENAARVGGCGRDFLGDSAICFSEGSCVTLPCSSVQVMRPSSRTSLAMTPVAVYSAHACFFCE